MMNEMDPPPASRLRRRSFFENMDSEPAAAGSDSVTLSEKDLTSAASAASASSSASLGDSGGGGLALDPHGFSPPPSSASAPATDASSNENDDHSAESRAVAVSPNSKRSRFRRRAVYVARKLVEMWRRVAAWLALRVHLLWLALSARFPTATARVESVWTRIRKLWTGTVTAVMRVIMPWRREAAAPVKYWVYPTQWLLYASVSLVVLQIAVFWRFQTLPLDLRVHECVFRERLLATADSRAFAGLQATPAPAAAALRFLERRFEQQHGSGMLGHRHAGEARKPWSCLAVVPTGGANAAAQARELAFLWPRSQVVSAAPLQVDSRVQVAVGASPLPREARADVTGVLAALFPLEAFRPSLFPGRFPDLVLVKTEFALRQMLKYRQERQEERDHRGRRDADVGGRTGTFLSAEAAADLAASQFGVFLLKTTVPDRYDRHIRKRWDEFLHVVAVADDDKKEQYTEELLAAWVAHPHWPMLHVRFQRSVALCGAFQRLLSNMVKDAEADAEAADAAERESPEDDTEAWLKRLERPEPKPGARHLNVDLVCDEEANTLEEISRLRNAIGVHLFPVPPETEEYEETILESAAAGAVTVTYNTPVMQEWVPDNCGLRVGTFEFGGPGELEDVATGEAEEANETKTPAQERELADNAGAAGLVRLPTVHVTSSEIEQAVEKILALDRVSRVAAGRAARVHYLRMRTHYLSAVAALDAAVCEGDSDEPRETQSEIGQHKRKKVEVETLRAFLY